MTLKTMQLDSRSQFVRLAGHFARPITPQGTAELIWGQFKGWRQRVIQRQTLAELDDHQLWDIGLTRSQALAEASKPFWQP